MPQTSRRIIVLLQEFLPKHLLEFDGLSKFVMSWIDSSESHFGSSEYFLNCWFYEVAK